jgi:ribose/xylose/arabinose/galactoside ABC-type transport system permease subunit
MTEAQVTDIQTAEMEGSRKQRWRDFSARYAIWISVGVLIVAAQILSGGVFLDAQNIVNILAQNSVAGVLATGQTLVILTAGIDLSLGSIAALSSTTILLLQGQGPNIALPVGIAVALGAGLLNGLLVTKGRIPPFIATLGMMQAALGLTYVISNAYPVYEETHWFLFMGVDDIGPLPLHVVVWGLVTVITWVILRRTRYGMYIYATGGNERAARVSGIPTNRAKLFVYTFAGLCAGVAAILLVNRLGMTQPNIGNSLTLGAIAPVVVGGTSLFGGSGGVWNTLAGVLIVGILVNLMVLMGINVYIQQVVQGIMILAVVFLFIRQQRRA